MKQVYIEPDIKTEELDSTELLGGSTGVTGGGTASDIDYGGEDDGSHEPEAKLQIQFADIWEDEEETKGINWDSFD